MNQTDTISTSRLMRRLARLVFGGHISLLTLLYWLLTAHPRALWNRVRRLFRRPFSEALSLFSHFSMMLLKLEFVQFSARNLVTIYIPCWIFRHRFILPLFEVR